jgi:hypothetical protein
MGSEWAVPAFPDSELSHIVDLKLLWCGIAKRGC